MLKNQQKQIDLEEAQVVIGRVIKKRENEKQKFQMSEEKFLYCATTKEKMARNKHLYPDALHQCAELGLNYAQAENKYVILEVPAFFEKEEEYASTYKTLQIVKEKFLRAGAVEVEIKGVEDWAF